MMHGMGAGLAMFALNFDSLSRTGTVYAIDLPGFARSSRPHFSSDPLVAEQQYVECLEHWRTSLGLEKIHLLGRARIDLLGRDRIHLLGRDRIHQLGRYRIHLLGRDRIHLLGRDRIHLFGRGRIHLLDRDRIHR